MKTIGSIALIAGLGMASMSSATPVLKTGPFCPSGYMHDGANAAFCVPINPARAPQTIVAKKCPRGWVSDKAEYCQR
jgi:hypothetical protein